MQNLSEKIKSATAFLQARGFTTPRVGIVLGTGLGELINHMTIQRAIPYTEIPYFPEATVEFHKGQLLAGTIGAVPVLAMQGRFHFYEGYTMQEVTFPIRVMKELGLSYLLLSNAAGGMNLSYKKGDLVIVEDHINMQPDNPLRGLNGPEFANRFPDMSCPYDASLRNLLRNAFDEHGVTVKEGIYVSVMGPNLESRAEYRWLRSTGADMVGMSTVPEVIVAAQLGIPCAAVSVITDECDPDHLKPVDISEIIAVAGKADKKLSAIFSTVISKLA